MLKKDSAKSSTIAVPYSILRNIYSKQIKSYIPESLHWHLVDIYEFLFKPSKKARKKKKIKEAVQYLQQHSELDQEMKDIIKYLQYNPFADMYPYKWVDDYTHRSVSVKKDMSCGLLYIEFDKKRQYFKKHVPEKIIRQTFNQMGSDMDPLSPHRYVTSGNHIFGAIERSELKESEMFFVEKGDVVADVGSSEANFSLSVIDIASHIYLFECDEEWTPALEKTFESYKDKVTIIPKYVSDKDGENTITLDTFFKDKKINFIKADIEGSEMQMLQGAKKLLAEREDLKLSVCTYHDINHPAQIEAFFKELGYSTTFTNGWVLYSKPPYLVKGVIRARKM